MKEVRWLLHPLGPYSAKAFSSLILSIAAGGGGRLHSAFFAAAPAFFPHATAAVVPLLPVFYFVRRRFRPLIQRRANDTQAETGRAIGRIAEHLGAVPQLHLMGAEESRVGDSNGSWREVVRAQWIQRRTEVGFS